MIATLLRRFVSSASAVRRPPRGGECGPRWAMAVLFILASACGAPVTQDDGAIDLVLTLAPAAVAASTDPMAAPGVRYPSGSRVVLSEPGGRSRPLSQGFEAAGAPVVSPAGDEVLFAGRRAEDGVWRVWRTEIRAARPVAVSDPAFDCIEPTFLAADRIAFTCAAPSEASAQRWSLYTASRTGAGPERVTFGPGNARAPTALVDGRILFLMERLGSGAKPGLFTVNPDGTLLEAFVDVHSGDRVPVHVREAVDGSVLALFLDPGSTPRAERLDGGAPMAPARVIRLPAVPPADRLVALEPAGKGAALVAYSAPGGPAAAYLQRREGWSKIWASAADERIVEVVAVMTRPAPRGRPRNVDPERGVGYLLGYDARRSDNSVGPPLGSPAPARVHINTMRVGAARRPVGGDAGLEIAESISLGEAAIHDDGSFFVEVPADVPLRLATLDANGSPVGVSDWFWVRPGEVRACFGCHESRAAAPVNASVSAIRADPMVLGAPDATSDLGAAQSGGSR